MKKLFLILSALLICILVSACDKEKEAYILFNKIPFTPETMLQTTNVFHPGDRIYYLVTTPNTVQTKRLLIQIKKLGKEERLGYETVWSKQVKVRDEQVYYYTNYVVLNEKGAYVMQAYSKDEPTKLLSSNNFYIRD